MKGRDDDHLTTEDEIVKTVYDNNINLVVTQLAFEKNYDLNYLYDSLYNNINIHNSNQLKHLPKESPERNEFLLNSIKEELKLL